MKAALPLLALSLCAAARVPPPPAPPAHFDAGRRAYGQARYEEALHEMMMALVENPRDSRAREYMRWAGEKLIEQDLSRQAGERGELLKAYRSELDLGKAKALAWNGWLLQSRASAAGGRWARAYDDAQRVLDDNPFHEDARHAQQAAAVGLARALAARGKRAPKDALVYRAVFMLADRQKEAARRAFADSLALPEAAEVEDERLRLYLARLTPKAPKPEQPAPAVAKPPVPAPPRVASRPKNAKKAPVAAPTPGEWAYSQGMSKLEAGLYDEAVELLERASAEAPEDARVAEALVRARLGLEQDMKRRRVEAAKLYGVGLLLYGQNRRAEAVATWRRVVSLDPQHGYASRALAHAEQELEEAPR